MVKSDVILHQLVTGISKEQFDIVISYVIIAELALKLREIIIIMVAL